eukprot:SAG25_NODE_287_length_10351_cov_22.194499_2_plen_86_part_00
MYGCTYGCKFARADRSRVWWDSNTKIRTWDLSAMNAMTAGPGPLRAVHYSRVRTAVATAYVRTGTTNGPLTPPRVGTGTWRGRGE